MPPIRIVRGDIKQDVAIAQNATAGFMWFGRLLMACVTCVALLRGLRIG
jgi:hypothetical protein